MIRSIAYFNYNHSQVNSLSKKENSANPNKITTTFKVDHLDISINYWKVKSISENIIDQIDEFFQSQHNGNHSQEELRSFYVIAKNAIDTSFENNYEMKELTSNENKQLSESIHQQTVKELKDWYHNGGEPREKVNLSSIEVTATSLEVRITEKIASDTT